MRRLLSISLSCLICTALAAQKVTFMPQWTAQAQFAGYYVALEKGFYKDEGLDVTIKHIGNTSTDSIIDQLVSGKVDIAGQQLLPAIIARSDGARIVNVMQLTQVCGLCCVARKPIGKPDDLAGLTIGRWTTSYIELADVLEILKGINATWVSALSPVNLFMFEAVDAIMCTSYSELIALLLKKGNIPEENILYFSEHGFDSPEDGLYVTERYLKRNRETVEKFTRASKKGWSYAMEHQDEALAITKKYTAANHIITNDVMQRRMLEAYLKLLVNPESGKSDYAPVSEEVFNKLNNILFSAGYINDMLDHKEMIRCVGE